MNQRKRKEAEWAALAQRFQLEALHGALRTLEGHVAGLESESARQAAALSRLDEQIAQLYAEAGWARPGAQELAATSAADRPGPSVRETRAVRQRSADPSTKFTPPELGQDWD